MVCFLNKTTYLKYKYYWQAKKQSPQITYFMQELSLYLFASSRLFYEKRTTFPNLFSTKLYVETSSVVLKWWYNLLIWLFESVSILHRHYGAFHQSTVIHCKTYSYLSVRVVKLLCHPLACWRSKWQFKTQLEFKTQTATNSEQSKLRRHWLLISDFFQLIQELKKENFDLKLRLYMEQKEREVTNSILFWC